MAPMIAYTLPAMQLVCNIVVPDAPVSNVTKFTHDLILNQTKDEEESIFEAGTSTPRTDPGEIPNGHVADSEIRVEYILKPYHRAIWLSAMENCKKNGQDMAVIDSWEKHDIVKNDPQFEGTPYVGIARRNGKWVNVNTESEVAMVPWADGQPTGTYDCVSFSEGRGLRDYACDRLLHFVCERPLRLYSLILR